MTIYAIYTRTAKGTIQRDHSMFEWNGSLGPYVHKAPLKGWCESTVFWVYEKGHSTGLAPICASPSDSSEVVAIQPSFDNRSEKNHRVIGG
jgi:hypothetical protein